MKLKDARQEASDLLRACRAGVDPREQRRAAKVDAELGEALRWERVVETFIDKHAKKNRSWRQTAAMIAKKVTPRWRGRLITDISRTDVVALLDKIEDEVSLYQANRVLAAIRKLFNWAMLRGLISSSPIVAGMAREGEVTRTRFLTMDEVGVVWRAAERIGRPSGRSFNSFSSPANVEARPPMLGGRRSTWSASASGPCRRRKPRRSGRTSYRSAIWRSPYSRLSP